MTTLKIGDAAPAFSAQDQDGNNHQLSDFAGKKLVVFFLPKSQHTWLYRRGLRP